MAELVDAIVEFDENLSPYGDDPNRVAIDLHHTHLPKLADADIIEYDREHGTIRLQSDTDQAVDKFIELSEQTV